MRRFVFVPLLFAGCQDYLFDQVCPEAIRESSIVVPALAPTPTDILFVVDNSGSMADEQENLANNFDQFIQQIAGAGDYHIAVVTTDTDKTPNAPDPLAGQPVEFEGLQNFVYSPTYPNVLTEFTGNCSVVQPVIEHGCFRGPDPATRIVDSNTMDAQAQISAFGQNVRVGSCGSGNEKGLLAMQLALDNRNACNAGFLRDNANLLVIIVSDEQDADNTAVGQYVEQLTAVKGGAAQIRVAVIVGYWDGRASDCNIGGGANCGGVCQNPPPRGSGTSCSRDNDCPNTEACISNMCDNPAYRYWDSCRSCSFYNSPDCCSAVAGGRYVDFALQMEQRIVAADSSVSQTDCRGGAGTRPACRIDTICQANFGETLAAIARDLVPRGRYNLNPPAKYPPGVEVIVKGGRFGAEGKTLVYATDFTVNDEGSVLELVGENTPQEGEEIEINFVVESEPRPEGLRGKCAVSGSP